MYKMKADEGNVSTVTDRVSDGVATEVCKGKFAGHRMVFALFLGLREVTSDFDRHSRAQ